MLMYNLSISLILFQGIFIEKKSHLYIKISLFEKNKEFCSKKVWSSNDKTGINFSKELKLNLQEREARNCSLLLQLKEYSGIGLRSEVQRFVKHWLCKSVIGEKISQLVLSAEGDPSSHYSTMLDKPGERIFTWHNAECFWLNNQSKYCKVILVHYSNSKFTIFKSNAIKIFEF